MPSPLADALGALGSEARLRLLHKLRTPKALAEIKLGIADEEDARGPMARQTVRRHLDVLIEAGIVRARPAVRDYGETTEYVVDHQRVYMLSEEVRDIARLTPAVEVENVTVDADRVARVPSGRPLLLVVKGLEEGAAFELGRRGPGPWVVGRRRDADVPLDFDPSVSAQNALIERADGADWLVDLQQSRNGTYLNFRRLGRDERARLRHGDVVGVGRTLLVYWSAPDAPEASPRAR